MLRGVMYVRQQNNYKIFKLFIYPTWLTIWDKPNVTPLKSATSKGGLKDKLVTGIVKVVCGYS